MNTKQIYATLELADHEVRLIVGEFFNTRFNIFQVVCIPCKGMSFQGILNTDQVLDAIQKALVQINEKLKIKIKAVITTLPSYRFKHLNSKQTVKIEGFDGSITAKDIQTAIKQAETLKYGDKYVRVQSSISRYTVNGVSSRKPPIGEHCSQLTVDVDMYYIDKHLAYDVANIIQQSGLKLMDIFVSGYAIAKEAALIEASLNKQIIVIDTQWQTTTLSQIFHGKLQNSVLFQGGLIDIVKPIMDKYHLKEEVVIELLKYGVEINKEIFSKNPIHMWKNENNELILLSEEEFMHNISPFIQKWIDNIANTCAPILKTCDSTVIVCGEAGEQRGFEKLLQKRLQVETRSYIPETLGGRDAKLSTCLGLFYAYQDKLPLYGEIDDSIDVDAFIRQVSFRKTSEKERREDTLTNRLKSMFTK